MKQYINEARRMQELAGIKSNQTAVEQLMPNVLGLMLQLSNNKISQRTCELQILKLFEQAKEMEKQQIVQAHGSGQILENGSDYIGMNEETNAEIYYDNTFK